MRLRQVETLNESQVADLHALYQREWWSTGRSFDDVQLVVNNSSLLIGFVDEDDRLVAFCRIITDFVFHAWVYDVIVIESMRGKGIGRQIMNAVADHPRLKRVSAVWLCCLSEMVPFYERWGFNSSDEELKWMVKVQREGWTGPSQ